jgi:hypothetical protein
MYWQMSLWWTQWHLHVYAFGQVEFNLAKASLFPIFVKLNFSLAIFFTRRAFTTKVYPSSFNLEKLAVWPAHLRG